MRRSLVAFMLVAVTLLASGPVAAQAVRRPGPRPPVRGEARGGKEELTQLARRLADAVVRADVNALDGILADNFRWSSGGVNLDKRTFRQAVQSGDLKVASWAIGDLKESVMGKSGVVNGRCTLTGAVFDGKDYSGEYEWTDRFVRRWGGGWRIVSSNLKRVTRAPARL